MNVLTLELHLCTCVFVCSLTWQQHTQGQLHTILRERRRGRIWRLASMSWRWPMNYGRIVVVWRPILPFPHCSLPPPTGVNMAAVFDVAYRKELHHLSSPVLESVGWWFCFFLPDWLLFGLLTGWDWWDLGVWPRGFYTRIDMHTPTHTDSSPLGYEPLSLGGYQKAFFYSCLFNFFPPFAKTHMKPNEWSQTTHFAL